MHVYRITKEKYSKDLTGVGAKTVGGRWNPKGVAMLYTSTTAALSALEVLAHLPAAYLPNDMVMVTISVPDELITSIDIKKLPDNWNEIPVPLEVQNFTMEWLTKEISLALKVPSTIIPSEKNILINPLHPKFNEVKLLKIEPFSFDSRLMK